MEQRRSQRSSGSGFTTPTRERTEERLLTPSPLSQGMCLCAVSSFPFLIFVLPSFFSFLFLSLRSFFSHLFLSTPLSTCVCMFVCLYVCVFVIFFLRRLTYALLFFARSVEACGGEYLSE